jgi:2-amino-4-hydroxy-6-hydroxymethyldihydropteridine diphosphokinase|tara:strand:- start:1363 stop:1758 length:396 start_codon:yes stop_codon:yes gene_type:complete
MNIAAIGVGSNINPDYNIKKAKQILTKDHKLLGSSSFIKTRPIGFKDENDFLNGAFLVSTDLKFDEFIEYLKKVEKKIGRIKSYKKFSSRTIDLDLVVWNDKIIDNDFFTRKFLRHSIIELLPNLNNLEKP